MIKLDDRSDKVMSTWDLEKVETIGTDGTYLSSLSLFDQVLR
jgi:hypothetical protein